MEETTSSIENPAKNDVVYKSMIVYSNFPYPDHHHTHHNRYELSTARQF